LKLTRAARVAGAAAAAEAVAGALGAASAAEKWPAGSRRAPLVTIRGAGDAPTAGLCLGTSRANPGVPV
jgi:hypothetical protein